MSTTKIESEERSLPEFHSVNLKGICNVYIKQGEEQSVKIGAEKDIIPKIATEVKDNELIISLDSFLPFWLVTAPTMEIHLVMKNIQGIKISGAGRVKTEGVIECENLKLINSGVGSMTLQLKAKALDTKLSGVGNIELSGNTKEHNIELSGTGKVDAFDLTTEKSNVDSHGMGECRIFVKKNLNAKASGIGKIKYKGNPKVKSQISGLGGLESID